MQNPLRIYFKIISILPTQSFQYRVFLEEIHPANKKKMFQKSKRNSQKYPGKLLSKLWIIFSQELRYNSDRIHCCAVLKEVKVLCENKFDSFMNNSKQFKP